MPPVSCINKKMRTSFDGGPHFSELLADLFDLIDGGAELLLQCGGELFVGGGWGLHGSTVIFKLVIGGVTSVILVQYS